MPPRADAGGRIAAWRRRGAQRVDPLGFALIEALARRAADVDGAARRLLDERLATLLDAFDARHADPARPRRVPHRARPLAELTEKMCSSSGELKAVRNFAATWNRLRTQQRMAQSFARAPENAGPLNSHALILRTLQALHELSPAYLDRFVGHADALLAIDAAASAGQIIAAGSEGTSAAGLSPKRVTRRGRR